MPNKNGSKWIRPERRKAIYARDNFSCVYCGCNESLTLDHLVPRVLGGSNASTNLLTACFKCNSARGSKSIRQFVEYLSNNLNIDIEGLKRKIRNQRYRKVRKES